MVECSPLVLFEAMAAGLPFVSLDVGNAREIAAWGGGGEIVESTRDVTGRVTAPVGAVAGAVDGLLNDHGLRRQMGEASREAWQQEFTWEEIAGRYAALYEDLAR
jgi:glycosyltransferase involved in cell wall biosynthesis